MIEELERLKEAEFVREFQSRLLSSDNGPAANIDEEPGLRNIFAPVDETDDA